MKHALIFGVMGLVLFTRCDASAQYAAIDLAPAQRAYIKDFVLKEKVRPTMVGERISMGATVPSSVELRAVPPDWGPPLQSFLFFYSDDRVHLVDPQSRRVVLDIY